MFGDGLKRRTALDVGQVAPRADRRQSEDESGQDDNTGRQDHRAALAPRLTEYRRQPPFQLGRGHGQGRDRHGRSHGKHACNVEQMRRVFGRPRTQCDDVIVASEFALDRQTPHRQPRQRIEPVHRACQPSRDLHEPIVALDVQQLMHQHDSAALCGPRLGRCRKKNQRAREAPGDGRVDFVALEQSDAARQFHAAHGLID